MDTAGVERVDFNALGGADLITINDLSGTDVRNVNVDLAGTFGGATGDGQPDQRGRQRHQRRRHDQRQRGRDGSDGEGCCPLRRDLPPEVANDRLEINTLAGTDAVDSSGLAAGAIQLFEDGVLVP